MSSGMRLLSGVLSVAQDHYPENLRKAFLVNVPGFFAGSWRLISAAIDKRTQQKIVISKDGGSEMLDTALGRAQEFGKTPSRASVWRTGDEWLGGGTDEVVHLSANSSWVHKQAVEVTSESGRVGGREIGQATYTDTGCRLFWYFHVEGECRSYRQPNTLASQQKLFCARASSRTASLVVCCAGWLICCNHLLHERLATKSAVASMCCVPSIRPNTGRFRGHFYAGHTRRFRPGITVRHQHSGVSNHKLHRQARARMP